MKATLIIRALDLAAPIARIQKIIRKARSSVYHLKLTCPFAFTNKFFTGVNANSNMRLHPADPLVPWFFALTFIREHKFILEAYKVWYFNAYSY